METKIFVNLPVKDLDLSRSFFKKLGFSINEQYSNETAACIEISSDIYAMLLTRDKFKEFTPKKLADSSRTTEEITALSVDSREKVNHLVDMALNAGATEVRPAEDLGYMYVRSFNDPDGHIWELIWINPEAPAQLN